MSPSVSVDAIDPARSRALVSCQRQICSKTASFCAEPPCADGAERCDHRASHRPAAECANELPQSGCVQPVPDLRCSGAAVTSVAADRISANRPPAESQSCSKFGVDATLALRARLELRREFGCPAALEFGDEFLDALFYGSLKSLAQRVEENGFCPTSYGEDRGICCYGLTHYPRDTAEAAIALSFNQMPRIARKILHFSLDHIPAGQYYPPHVYRRDGSVKANTIQIDTPGHLARALLACVSASLPERDPADRHFFAQLSEMFRAVRQHHYHARYRLFDAGNYNEQFDGGAEPLLDLFTNSAMYSGYLALARLAEIFSMPAEQREFTLAASELQQGLEENLFDRERGFFRCARNLISQELVAEDNWIILYCQRWLPFAASEIWRKAYGHLSRHTALHWSEEFTLVTGEAAPRNFMMLGKVFAQQLGHFAAIGDWPRLRHHLDFLRATVRSPENLYPEWWYHHFPAELDGYYADFLRDHRGLWMPYTEDPHGDYTVDSGNCEQTAVFVQHCTAAAPVIQKIKK